MKKAHTQIDRSGRILIPSQIRNTLDYKLGDTFVLDIENGNLHLTKIQDAIRKAQEMVSNAISNNASVSLVDELIKERRREVEMENEEMVKYEQK